METIESTSTHSTVITEIDPQGSFLYCTNCHSIFEDEECHRMHYGSDWHYYNLKRKIVGLPHATHDEFKKCKLQFSALQYSDCHFRYGRSSRIG